MGLMTNLVTQPKMRITQALKTIRQQSRGVRMNISMSTPGDIEWGLQDGRLHVGTLQLINTLSGLEYSPLYEERSLLYCSSTHPAAGAGSVQRSDLRTVPAVAPSQRIEGWPGTVTQPWQGDWGDRAVTTGVAVGEARDARRRQLERRGGAL